tara:strand:+ start:3331 stop:6744 length:3414 start_codon:yes stop_codon:yes gene_type:complete
MATYVPGSETYLPDIKPFTPDYKFLSAVLGQRQDKYNTNWQATNDIYNKVIYADISREDTNSQREQFANNLAPNLEKIAGLDLSMRENVQAAKSVFQPFLQNDLIMKDMAVTANYRDQMALAERYKNSPDADTRKLWHRDGVVALQYKMESFMNDSADQALNFRSPDYVPEANIMALSEEILGEMKPPLKLKVDHFGVNSDGSVNTDWIVTDVNGEKLVGPALQIIRNQLQQDPRVVDSYQVKAYVASMDFGKAKQADGTFATVDEGRMAWAVETLTRAQENNAIRLTEGAGELRNLNNINVRWQNYQATNGIIPGSDEAKTVEANMSAYEKTKMQMQQDQKIATIIDTPPEGLESTLSTAYQVLMLTNMDGDMLKAAKSYSMRDMESTFRVNPYAKMDKQFKYDMRKEARRASNNLYRDSENDRRARQLAIDKGDILTEEQKTQESALRISLQQASTIRGNAKTNEYDKEGDVYQYEAIEYSNKMSKATKSQASQVLSSLRQVDPMGKVVDGKGTYQWSMELDGKKVTGDMNMLEEVLYSTVPLTDDQAADEDFMASYQPEYIYQDDIDRMHDERVELMTSVDENGALNILQSHTSEIVTKEYVNLARQMQETQENVGTVMTTHANLLEAYARSGVKTDVEAEKNNDQLVAYKENGYPSIFQKNASGVSVRLGKEEYADLVEKLARDRKLTNYDREWAMDGNDDPNYMKDARAQLRYFHYEEYQMLDFQGNPRVNKSGKPVMGKRHSSYTEEKVDGVRNYRTNVTYVKDQFGEVIPAGDRVQSKVIDGEEVKMNYTIAKIFDTRTVRKEANYIYDEYNTSFKDGLNGKLTDEVGILETGTLNAALQGLDNTVGNLRTGTLYKGDFNPKSVNEGQGAIIYTQYLDQMANLNSLGIQPTFYMGDEENFDVDDTSPAAKAFMDEVRQDVIADMQPANKKSTRTSARGEWFYAPVYGDAEDMDKSTSAYIFKPTEDYVASKVKGGGGASQWAGLKEAERQKILNGGITIMLDQKDDINPRKVADNWGNSIVADVMGSPNQTYRKSVTDGKGDPSGNYSISRVNQNLYVMNYQYSTYQEGGSYIPSTPMITNIPISRETGGYKALNVNKAAIEEVLMQRGLLNMSLKLKDKGLNAVKGKKK